MENYRDRFDLEANLEDLKKFFDDHVSELDEDTSPEEAWDDLKASFMGHFKSDQDAIDAYTWLNDTEDLGFEDGREAMDVFSDDDRNYIDGWLFDDLYPFEAVWNFEEGSSIGDDLEDFEESASSVSKRMKAIYDKYAADMGVDDDEDFFEDMKDSYVGEFANEDEILKYFQKLIDEDPEGYEDMTADDLWGNLQDDGWIYEDGLLFNSDNPF